MADDEAVVLYGAPATLWIRYTVRPLGATHCGVDIDFQMFNKTSTRLPEALLYVFRPQHSRSWHISKLGHLIDPLNVLLNGSQYQHVVDDNGIIFDASSKDHSGSGAHLLQLRSPDVPIACPLIADDLPHVFPAPLHPLSAPITGFAFNIYNNIWDTNFIMWYPYCDNDAHFRARFYVDI